MTLTHSYLQIRFNIGSENFTALLFILTAVVKYLYIEFFIIFAQDWHDPEVTPSLIILHLQDFQYLVDE